MSLPDPSCQAIEDGNHCFTYSSDYESDQNSGLFPKGKH